MKRIHVPAGGLRYWVALCFASILGCNAGDLFSSFFGNLSGLPVLAGAFAVTLFAERRDRIPKQIYYWTSIIIIRTAATNLADFTDQRVGNASYVLLGGLLLAALAIRSISFKRSASQGGSHSVIPNVDWLYWVTMLLAGTLGTAIGDFLSFRSGLGLPGASLAEAFVVVALVAIGSARFFRFPLFYWATVVAIRTAGTSAGDFFAHTFGLPQSALTFITLLTLVVAVWNERRSSELVLQPAVVTT